MPWNKQTEWQWSESGHWSDSDHMEFTKLKDKHKEKFTELARPHARPQPHRPRPSLRQPLLLSPSSHQHRLDQSTPIASQGPGPIPGGWAGPTYAAGGQRPRDKNAYWALPED